MEPVGTDKKGRVSAAEILNPWVSWEWEADLETCADLDVMLRCSTYEFPYVPGDNHQIHSLSWSTYRRLNIDLHMHMITSRQQTKRDDVTTKWPFTTMR